MAPNVTADDLADAVEQIADHNNEIAEGDRPTVTVEYKTDHGNTRSRTGDVWYIDTDPYQWRDDVVIRFSENAGERNEDPYYIAIRGDDAVLVSISMNTDTETNLGEITNIEADGLDTDDEQPVATDGGTDADDRAFRALTDVIEVEEQAPGLMRVVTWSDAYMVDARDAGCNCPDKQYRDDVTMCKHDAAAILAMRDDVPTPYDPETPIDHAPVATDGGAL